MNRLFESISDYFGFSRKEVRGFLALIGLILLLWVSPMIYDRFLGRESKEITEKDIRTADSLALILEKIQPQKRNYSSNYKQKYDYENTPDKPLVLTDFDPNKADIAQLESLGFPSFLAERIIKYRSKGGKFRKKEDLQKIYGLRPELYQKLEFYISISTENQADNSNSASEKSSFIENKPTFTKPVLMGFDINEADTTQLIKLRGIGSKLATRIIKFRDGLGGFHSISQYNEIFGLDSLAISELQKYGQLKRPTKKTDLNTATIDELDRHPYISGKQAQLIVRYREQHGNYSNVQDLLKIKVFDVVWLERTKPYLEVRLQ